MLVQAEIWRLREDIGPALQLDGYVYKYDISLPLDVFYQVSELQKKVSPSCRLYLITLGSDGDEGATGGQGDEMCWIWPCGRW